jgi:hypothetical protein
MKSNNDGRLNFECLITPRYSLREVLSIWYLSGGRVGENYVCTSNKFREMDIIFFESSREFISLFPISHLIIFIFFH